MQLDSLANTARASYQYSRYALDSFESQMLQIKAITNVVTANRSVVNFLTENDSQGLADAQESALSTIANLTSTYSTIHEATLFSTPYSGETAKQKLKSWQGEIQGIPGAEDIRGWYYRKDDSAGDHTIFWIQSIVRKERAVGVLQIRLKDYAVPDAATNIANVIGGDCLIFEKDGHLIYEVQQHSPEEIDRARAMLVYAEGYHTINRQEFVSVLHCNAMGLVFLTTGAMEPAVGVLRSHWFNFLFTVVLLAIPAAIAIWLHNVGVTQRIKLLSNRINLLSGNITKMENINSLKPIDDFEGKDEISELASNFNIMLQRFVDLVQSEHSAQMLRQVAKFNALQAQIQPHFLYNTLETLRMMADEHDDQEVANMLFVLGKLMRSSISGSEQETTLGRELENIVNYLKLNKLRFSKLCYEINCEMDIEHLTCPRFILQPIVENSIHHGLSKTRRNWEIRIHIYEKEGFCLLDVYDNGIGIDIDRLEEIHRSLREGVSLQQMQGGIGIFNVHSRLRMFYGEQSGIEIISVPDVETLCRIKIQLAKKGAPDVYCAG